MDTAGRQRPLENRKWPLSVQASQSTERQTNRPGQSDDSKTRTGQLATRRRSGALHSCLVWTHADIRMIKKLRFWLAAKIIGSNAYSVLLFGAKCVSRAMEAYKSEYAEWECANGRKYAAAEITNETRPDVAMGRCSECEHVFEGNPDGKCSCPKCGSGDCLLLF